MYLLPLDQRMPWHVAAITAAKWAVYDGFRHALADAGLPPGDAGVIADERSAAPILRDAATRGLTTVCVMGRVGDFGANAVAGHATKCEAAYWKVVVNYNPDEGHAVNAEQVSRVKCLSHALRHRARPRLMCDLVVPPTQRQLLPDIRAYGRRVLPGLTTHAIAELLNAGVDPDVWAIEGFEREDEYRRVVATAAGTGRPARFFVRAAGHSDNTTRRLMTAGLSVPGIAGVVLARAPFWEPAVAWMSGRTSRAIAVATVQAQVRDWISVLEPPRGLTLPVKEPANHRLRPLRRIEGCDLAFREG